jgi:spore coat protein A
MATEPNELGRRVGMISRRQFLKATAATGVVASVGGFLSPRGAHAFVQSPGIPLFKTALRGVGPGQIPVAAPQPLPAPVTGVTHYQILIKQFQDQILPVGFNKTTLWGYDPFTPLGGGSQPQKHLGGIIVGKGRNPNDPNDKAVPIQITFHNQLFVQKHLLPVDTTIPGANQAINRMAVHMHGGLVPWISDGGPFDWFGPIDDHGLSFLNNRVLQPIHLPGAAAYYYPLNQSARFMWYHDHAYGITRLNAYAGVASAMLIRDKFEADLVLNSGLPPYIESSVLGGKTVQELPLVFQDKVFVGGDIASKDPKWSSMVQVAATKPGSLWYAHTYEPNQLDGTGRWDLGTGGLPLPDPSSIPEFFGDTMLVNGTVFPAATVEARRYRLRLLNACNARFLNLQLYMADSSKDGITLDLTGSPNPFLADNTTPNPAFNPKYGTPLNMPFLNAAAPGPNQQPTPNWLQIGTEGGFLAKPVTVPCGQPLDLNGQDPGSGQVDPSQVLKSLLVAPAERPDLIVDFGGYGGQSLILYNDAPSPFPGGDDRNDYFPGLKATESVPAYPPGAFGVGNPVNGITKSGFGPNTRVLMRFNVVAPTGGDTALGITTSTDLTGGIDPFLDPTGVPTRLLTLNEYFDERGRLIQILGNAEKPSGSPYDTTSTYLDYPPGVPTSVGATEENVNEGDKEVWEVYNTTGDVHPMHFHLVNVQVINRQLFSGTAANPIFAGPPIAPAENEVGWKETVPMYPGTVTRVIMKFELAKIVDKNGDPINTAARPLIGQLPITDGQPPESPRTGGHEYVWHCHILEHEEHDMMHALVVKPKPKP